MLSYAAFYAKLPHTGCFGKDENAIGGNRKVILWRLGPTRNSMTACQRTPSNKPSSRSCDGGIYIEGVREPAAWFLSLARFADQARVMETMLDAALEVVPEHGKLRRVRGAWIVWDRALGNG